MNIHIILVNQSLLSHNDWIPGHGWIKGLIIPGHILLSDKKPEGKCDQNTRRGSSAPEGVLVTFLRGFSSDSNIWPGMINPDYDICVYNNSFNYLSWIILILPRITGFSTSRWEDRVTATKIRGFATPTKTPWDERMFKSGLINLMSIVLCVCFTRKDYSISVYNNIFNYSLRNILIYFQNVLSCILYHLGGRIK